MPSRPLRFIHAARLLLDHQLRGVGPLPAESQLLVEDATLIAFNRVIDACLANEVDFLLIVGDSFERHDRGLRGQAALARGLARLEDRDIPAFVTSGRRDPWSAWLPGLRFTENVHRLDPNAAPVPFQRDGRTLARVCALDPTVLNTAPHSLRRDDDDAYSIVLAHSDDSLRLRTGDDRQHTVKTWLDSHGELAVDYWAIGGGHSPQTWSLPRGVAHDPGSPQGLLPGETGVHGCTLWDVDLAGHARPTFVPTSTVRYESRHLSLQPHWRRDDLLHAMDQSLRSMPTQNTEAVWLVTWRFDGDGPLFESLSHPTFRNELLHDLRSLAVSGVYVAHDFRVPVYVPQTLGEGDNRFAADYVRTLAERTGRTPAMLLAESAVCGEWESRLAALLSELDEREIAARARGAGLRWFAAREGVSA